MAGDFLGPGVGFYRLSAFCSWIGTFPGLFGFTQQPFRVDQVRMERKMKWLPVTAVLIAGPAFAQSSELESACTSVARNFFMTETLNVGVVQSFPELKPPGVRFKYSERSDTKKAEMSDTFDCEFDQPNPITKLLRFCVSRTCYSSDQEDGERRRRFEEMQLLMQRGKSARK